MLRFFPKQAFKSYRAVCYCSIRHASSTPPRLQCLLVAQTHSLPRNQHPKLPANRVSRHSAAPTIFTSQFHTTPSRRAAPIVPFLLAALKTSTALEGARTVARVALTLAPILAFKNIRTKKFIQIADDHDGKIFGKEVTPEQKVGMLRGIKNRTRIFKFLLLAPWLLFWATIVASLERTPLTGRWRLIILSPEEEDTIAASLAGPGWHQAIGNILAQEGSPPIIPSSDWRYQWVRDTLRHLEGTIPVLQNECSLEPKWLTQDPDDLPLPPPADYPLRPRPRGTEYLRWFSEMCCSRTATPSPHAIPGPPYSLVLVDKPAASNAFSYGFGPEGAGGIVVYSGILDDILAKAPQNGPETLEVEQPRSWLSSLFGGLPSNPESTAYHPIPTPDQTSELAILLSHELAHLILAHHLESLSSSTVIVPGVISIMTDIVRTLLFPVTMIFGPFVNDAVAQLGRMGSGELIKVGEYCTGVGQEIEADVVSVRLLAHAGFDARDAVQFWEDQNTNAKIAEGSQTMSHEMAAKENQPLHRAIMGINHPVNEVRIEKLKGELVRWEMEKRSALDRMRKKALRSSGLHMF